MSGEEVTRTEKGIVKREVSREDFRRWFGGGGEVEREEKVYEKEEALSA